MARLRDYDILARLKIKKAEIEEQIKEKEKTILNNNPAKEIKTRYGKLCLASRKNYKIENNFDVINNTNITNEDFIQASTISTTNLKKLIGEIEFNELLSSNVISYTGESQYYSLKKYKEK